MGAFGYCLLNDASEGAIVFYGRYLVATCAVSIWYCSFAACYFVMDCSRVICNGI